MSKGIRLSPEHGMNPMVGQCPLCGGDGDELFLLGRLPGDAEAPRKGVVPGMSQPCKKCKDCMGIGVMLVVCKDGSDKENPYRTGEIQVVTDDYAERIGIDVTKHRAVFIEEAAIRKLGIPKPKGDNNG